MSYARVGHGLERDGGLFFELLLWVGGGGVGVELCAVRVIKRYVQDARYVGDRQILC